MRFRVGLGLAFAASLSFAAWAQDPTEAQNLVPACSRGATSMKVAGVDFDELRCRLAVLQASQAQTTAAMLNLQAASLLTKHDLEDARKALAEKQEAITWWAKCVKDAACRDWVVGGPLPVPVPPT